MPKVEERVVIASAADLQLHFDSILPQLHLVESEDSWQKIEKSLVKLEVITKSGGYKYESFPSLFKGVAPPIISSLLSERTKLSGTAADLINSVAPRLGERFETLVNVFVPALLLISARTNKVALVRAKKCLLLIAKHCKLVSLLPHLREGSKDKSQTARSISVEATLMLLESIESKDRLTAKRIADVETIIKGTATDRDPEVRQWCKKLFELYVEQWPDRASSFTSTFTPTTRRYLALSKNASAPTRAAPTPTQRFSPPPVRRPQQPKEFVVKQAYGPAKARSHLGVLSTNVHATGPTVISPTLTKQKVHQSAATPLVSSKPRSRQQQQQQQAPSHPPQSNDEGRSTLKDKQEQQPQEYSQEEEEKRASLRAELLKQATGTPSQGVAARLALEKFEFQLKKSQGSSGREEFAATQIHRDTDRLLFNVAMSKKQSPKKGPGRIIVTAQPPVQSTSRATATNTEASKSAQRLASSSSGNKLKSKAAPEREADGAEAEEEEEAEPDVFRSRPIGKARVLQPLGGGSAVSSPKVASSTTRGLGGRERLLGPSMRNANRAKMVSSSSKKNLFDKKASSLKIDLGKENIPPDSMLASLAQQASVPSSPKEDAFAPGIACVETTLPSENIDRQEQVTGQVHKPVLSAHLLAGEDEGRHNGAAIPSDDTLDMATKIPLPTSSDPATPVVEQEEDKSAAAVVDENDAANGDCHALDDWAQVAQSLDAVVASPPPSAPQVDTTASSTKQGPSLSSPCKKVSSPPHFSPPSMSTPLRKPLGALQGNGNPAPPSATFAPAPLAEKQMQEAAIIDDDRRSHTKTPAKCSASSPTKKSHSTPSAHIRKVFSLLASRKM